VRRREFIGFLGGAAAWPLGAHAQQPPMPVIGYLSTRSPEDTIHLFAAFRAGLAQNGYVEGQNATIEYRWALGQYERLPGLAAELVRRPVTVLAATGGEPAAFAALNATSTIPIVYLIGGDPVKEGIAASFNRPGGNATGVTLLTNSLEPKRFSLLRDLRPGVPLFGVLLNPKFPAAEPALRDVEAPRSPSVSKFSLFGRVLTTRSMRLSTGLRGHNLLRSQSPRILFSIRDAKSFWHSRRAMRSRRSTSFANTPRQVASSAMGSTTPMPIVRLASTLGWC